MTREDERAIRESMRAGISGRERFPTLDEFRVTKTEPAKEYDVLTDLFEIYGLMADD